MSNGGAPIRVYFLGSGSLGVPILERLADDPVILITGAGTQPDRPQGRHRRLAPTPLGEAAVALGLVADKPLNVNAPEVVDRLRALALDLIVVVSYGQLLRAPLLALPRCGCLNVHASLLPRHRGAAPIQAAIQYGDAETGISFMRMDAGLDTGPVYGQVRLPLCGRETAMDLQVALAGLAAGQIVRWVRAICHEGLQPAPQPTAGATVARKITKEQGRLDWRLDANLLGRQVRAFNPWPGSWFDLPTAKGRRRLLVTAAVVEPVPEARAPGVVFQADQNGWRVACGQGALRIERVVPEGRGEMAAAEFLRGCLVVPGTRLETQS